MGTTQSQCETEFNRAYDCVLKSRQSNAEANVQHNDGCTQEVNNMLQCFQRHPEVSFAGLPGLDTMLPHEAAGNSRVGSNLGSGAGSASSHTSSTASQSSLNTRTGTGGQRPLFRFGVFQDQPLDHTQTQNQSQENSNLHIGDMGYESEHDHGKPSVAIQKQRTKRTAEDAVPETDSLVPKREQDSNSSDGRVSSTKVDARA